MNLEEIRTEVEIKVEDPSYGPDRLNGFINDCVRYAAGLVNLPTLKRIKTVDTVVSQSWVSVASVSSPETFSGVLRRVRKANSYFPTVYPDVERLMEDYDMESAGEVVAVALEGSTLWYANIPETSETLTLLLYVNPSLLKMNEDIPSDFPEHVHRKLFIHGSAWMVFDEIEDRSELEGQKVKTAEHFWQAFDEKNPVSGINLLHRWMAMTQPHHISSVWNY
jgi:hypothetical protein